MSLYANMKSQRFVGWVSILSFGFCLVAIYAIIAAVDYQASLGYLPVEAIEVAKPHLVFAWGVFDFLGYYLMRVPLILFLWIWMRPRNPLLVDTASVCGLFFVVLAVTATSVLTGATIGIMQVYSEADASMKVGLESAWEASVAIVRQGLWQFSMVPWTIWACVMGRLLASDERWLGWGLLTIGFAAGISAIDPYFGHEVEALLGPVHDYQVHFSSVWMLWAGIVLLRRGNLLEGR